MIVFHDLLYGRIELPDWLTEFVRLPEFARLRGVRLSNVDSIEFKDLATPTRWEHGIAVSYLAWRVARARTLSLRESVQLCLAGLLHDVATPPFAHTAEYVLDEFDHEVATQSLLQSRDSLTVNTAVFASSLPQFERVCERTQRRLGVKIDIDEIARMVVGDGQLGFLIAGTLDLDNADNVVRGLTHIGGAVERRTPIELAEWLATQDSSPVQLENVDCPAVQRWVQYRADYYSFFFRATDIEIGRQAFLQHLMRRALLAGLPRTRLVWNTDEGLLETIATIREPKSPVQRPSLADLVNRYRLMEQPRRIAVIDLTDDRHVRSFRLPQAVAWLEEHLTTDTFEPAIAVTLRRFARDADQATLFPTPKAVLHVFSVSGGTLSKQLPDWLRSASGHAERKPRQGTGQMATTIAQQLDSWVDDRPWLGHGRQARENLSDRLNGVGDWSFRLTRNESLHPYPSTFVHAIPSSLLAALGLRGETILDPFGGTGQTALESVKAGGIGISADTNAIACLVARTRLTFLPAQERSEIRDVTEDTLRDLSPEEPPEFELRARWHHSRTLTELCQIRRFATSTRNSSLRQFYLTALSAILPYATARKGKQHGFFADNTPLPAGESSPPYEDAVALYLSRISRNVQILEKLYSSMEREGNDPATELARGHVMRVSATCGQPSDYGVAPNSVAAIITSPPYLCMSDYALGQRLSYEWLFPSELAVDFGVEIGARRRRGNPREAADCYFSGLRAFAASARDVVRSEGFVALVVGEPVAKRFESLNILSQLDEIMRDGGFDLLWNRERSIQWHRNHGYQRLRSERIAVYRAP